MCTKKGIAADLSQNPRLKSGFRWLSCVVCPQNGTYTLIGTCRPEVQSRKELIPMRTGFRAASSSRTI